MYRKEKEHLEGDHDAEKPHYGYLDSPDLNDLHIEATRLAYETEASMYSQKIEWDNYTFEAAWKSIYSGEFGLKDWIRSLPKDSVASVPGSGSFRDLMTLALLNKRLRVVGYDISSAMVEEGRKNLNWNRLIALAQTLGSLDNTLNGWVKELLETIEYFSRRLTELTDDEYVSNQRLVNTEAIVDNFTRKISYFPGNVEEAYHLQNFFDLHFVVAVTAHIKKEKLPDVISNLIKQLKPGGKLYFDLRADSELWESEGSGRVFYDTKLGFPRYFTTFTRNEVENLLTFLRNSHIIDIEGPRFWPNPDPNKPPFLMLLITRKVA